MKSPTVRSIDILRVKDELKKCPKIIQDYVKALNRSVERWQRLVLLKFAGIDEEKLSECVAKVNDLLQKRKESE
jgi:hypothetical protein